MSAVLRSEPRKRLSSTLLGHAKVISTGDDKVGGMFLNDKREDW